MRHLLREEGLEDEIEIDSAGTGGWHAGNPPDAARPRRRAAAGSRSRAPRGRSARATSRTTTCCWPPTARTSPTCARSRRTRRRAAKVRLLREFDPASHGDLDVPDPYYGGPDGFEEVLDLVEAACRGLLAEVR